MQRARSSDRPPTRWLRIGIPALLVLVWLVGGSVGGPYFGKVDEVATNDQSSFLPESADATQVSERLPDFLGDDSIPAVVVVTGEAALTDEELADLQTLSEDIAAIEGVLEGVSPPIESEDGQAVQIFVPIDSSGEVREVVEEIRTLVSEELPSSLEGWVTGPAGFTADLVKGFLGIDGLLLVVALIAVFIILVIVYRSPLLPILVLLTSVFALCVALLTVWWLAYAGIVVLNGQVQGILFILVIGAATDYALLYVARFREAIGTGARRWDATTQAWRGSFEPIIASGGTVIAGLLCLLLSDLATNRALGPIASIGIAFSVLSALTFLPALLALFGKTAFWPFIPKQGMVAIPDDLTQPAKGFWPRQARFVARHARPVWIASTLVLLIAAVGVLQLKADGVPSSDLVLGASEARDGQVALAEHFPAGSGSPVYVIVPEDDVAAAVEVLEASDGIESVAAASEDSPTGQAEVTVDGGEAVFTVAGPPGAEAPSPTVSDGDVLLIGTLTDAADSAAAEDTVRELRTSLDEQLGVGTALVGGVTATDIDSNDTSIRDRTIIIPVVLLVILLILMLLLRAILAPVLLILSVILSFARSARRQRARVQPCARVPGRRPRRAAVRIRLPRRARCGLQHLPDVARAGGVARARHASRHPARSCRDRRRHHLGGSRPGGDLRRPRGDPDPLPRADRVHRRVRRAAGHLHRALAPRAGRHLRHRSCDLVAVEALADGRHEQRCSGRGADPAGRPRGLAGV